MPTRRMPAAGMAPARRAGLAAAALRAVACRRALPPAVAPVVRSPLVRSLQSLAGLAAAALLAGCATLTETTDQYVMVQTVLDHQPVAGVGCVLANDTGRWFVTSPGRVKIRKSTKPLAVDCRVNDVYAVDQIDPKQNSSRWGNILLTAGAGQLIDRQTGAGFDYPTTLTVLLQRVPPGTPPGVTPAPQRAAQPSQPPQPAQPAGGSPIY